MRECGSCNECCTVFEIAELSKPMHTPCQHVRSGTRCCAIYSSRPKECQTFTCHYLWGWGGAAVRPDRLGGILVQTLPDVKQFDDFGLKILHAFEVQDGAFKRPQWLHIVRRLDASGMVCLCLPKKDSGGAARFLMGNQKAGAQWHTLEGLSLEHKI